MTKERSFSDVFKLSVSGMVCSFWLENFPHLTLTLATC